MMSQLLQQLKVLVIPIVLVIWGGIAFFTLYPSSNFFDENFGDFSTDRSFEHVKILAQSPHYIGSDGHAGVRNYIINQLESYGLDVHTQTGISYTKNGVVSIPQNIVAKIPGTNPSKKALLLTSHYDSAVHSSFGAADAASGVATILETVRFFLNSDTKHKNDIIIFISDGEEIGLNGAYLFAKEHPWANDVGLVLNFEARGAAGPSNMLLETNTGNASLISTFKDAKIKYPVANSLMYSIYKLLPNDTDSTIFREELNIPSFFFAFIDAHYIYHTSLDKPENLSRKSLDHQAAYLLQLLPYYANVDLETLHSKDEMIYFDFPFLDLMSYPFVWSIPIWLLTLFLFLLLIYVAKVNDLAPSIKSFVYALVLKLGFLVILSFLGYFIWEALLYFYPNYALFLQGFPYNGHFYIFSTATLAVLLSIVFIRFVAKKQGILASSMASHTIWLILTLLLSVYLNGASYLVIPLIFSLLMSFIQCFNFKYKHLFQLLFAFPIIVILAPYVQFFPVGLGLKFLFTSLVLILLTTYLLAPLIFQLKQTKITYSILLVFVIVGLVAGHMDSKFSQQYPRPSSLVYLQSNDEAYFGTYESNLSPWNKDITKNSLESNASSFVHLPSKYGNRFKRLFEAPVLEAEKATFDILKQPNVVTIDIKPAVTSNRLELFLDEPYSFKRISVNGKEFRGNLDRLSFLLAYHVVNREAISVRLELGDKPLPSIQLFETSYQLVPHNQLEISERPLDEMVMPFVVSDAIIIHQTLTL